MKKINEKFPEFKKEAVVSLELGKEFATLTNANIAGYELIPCALMAWHLMAAIIINDLAGNLQVVV